MLCDMHQSLSEAPSGSHLLGGMLAGQGKHRILSHFLAAEHRSHHPQTFLS